VTLIQRFGSALNLNPHLHMLFLHGAFTFNDRQAAFHRARRKSRERWNRSDGGEKKHPGMAFGLRPVVLS